MGTIKKGILGGFSGKVGNVVGASWKSIAYIRSLPSSVRNPRTEKQRTQRSKFALVAKFVKSILPVIRVGFKQSAGPVNSAFSAAVSYNILHAVKGTYPGFEIDYPKVVVARGALYIANHMTAAPEAGSLNFVWDTGVINNASAATEMMGLLERTVAHTELLQLQRVEDHRRITGLEKMVEQELAWRKDGDYHYCEVEDCRLRKPPMGTFKREHHG